MEDKKTLGKFIQTKRKENNLSQKELAQKLYVTESAVSKWERGISYPDITMISGICKALNISEHELCIASEDYKQRNTELMAKNYKKLVKGYTIITGICYICAIIPCFIANIVNEGRLSWFFILLTSLMLTFSIINIPVLIRKNTALITLGCSWISLNLLLAAGCLYSGDDWFLMAFLSILLGMSIISLPFVLRAEPIEKHIGNNKSLICFASDTIILFLVIIYGTLKYGTLADLKGGLIAAAVCCSLIWIYFLVIRYLKINAFFKAAICTLATGIYYLCANIVTNMVFNNRQFQVFYDNLDTLITIILLISSAIIAAVGVLYAVHKKNKNT